jgi:hypothetical protein
MLSECSEAYEEEHPLLVHELRRLTEAYNIAKKDDINMNNEPLPPNTTNVVEKKVALPNRRDKCKHHDDFNAQLNNMRSDGWILDQSFHSFIGQHLIIPSAHDADQSSDEQITVGDIIAYFPKTEENTDALFKASFGNKDLIELSQCEVEIGMKAYQLRFNTCSDTQLSTIPNIVSALPDSLNDKDPNSSLNVDMEINITNDSTSKSENMNAASGQEDVASSQEHDFGGKSKYPVEYDDINADQKSSDGNDEIYHMLLIMFKYSSR